MRTLALDHGTVRVGVACSDELGMIATPMEFIPAEPRDQFLKRLLMILNEKRVERIIVGMPRNMDGSFGDAAEKVKVFVEWLRGATQVPIRTWDERLTSAQANRQMIQAGVRRAGRKEKVDAAAAAILLQSFLDASS
jgi:putative Holliday junction resolvase